MCRLPHLKPRNPPRPRMQVRKVASFVAAILPAVSFATPAASSESLADLGLEELLQITVVSASRFEQSTTEAPATVTVIGEEELRQRGYRNLAEALVTVPGVYSSNDRMYTYLGVRGLNRPGDYGSRLLLLTDGARRNDPLFDQALFGNESPIEIDWVKRLEFVSGPASAVYGSNALFGTVNTIMLDGGDINGARVTLDAGSFGSKRAGMVAGERLDGGREWFLGVSAYKAEGADLYFPEYDNGVTDGHARGLDGEHYEKAYAKLRFGNWRLTGNFSSRKKDLPTAPYETTFGESGTWARDEYRLLELRYDGDTERGWQPSYRLFTGGYRYDGNYNYTPLSNTRDRAVARWYGGEFHLAYTAIPKHKLMFGVDSQWNWQLEQRYFEVAPYTSILNTNDPSRTISAFVQDEWQFQPDWRLNIGLRHDRTKDFEPETSPRVALIWQATNRLTLKAMGGRAFRVPNAYERFYNDQSVTQAANPTLSPERVSTAELASAYRFGQNGRVGLSLYSSRIQHLIDQTTDASGVSTYTNQAMIRSRGVELDAENHWASGLRLRGSVAWQRSRVEDGTGLVDSPQRMGKLIFGIPLWGGWTASGEMLGVSSRKGVNGPVPGYGIANLAVSTRTDARLGQISLVVNNLGDKHYHDPATASLIQHAIEQDGRQFHVRWTLGL